MDPFDLTHCTFFQQEAPAFIDQVAIDSRRIHGKCALFVALKGKRFDGHNFLQEAAEAGAKYALVDETKEHLVPASLTLLKVKSPLQAFQEIAAKYRRLLPTKIVAITGSFGKTMVKDLLLEMAKTRFKAIASPESFNSQIGVPLSLLSLNNTHEVAFIEAAISHPGEMERLAEMIAPNCTLLTHIGNKHITTLGSLKNAAVQMAKLFKKPQEWLLLPQDHNLLPITASHHFWNVSSPTLPHARYSPHTFPTLLPYTLKFPDGTIYSNQIHSGYNYFLDLINISTKAAHLLGLNSDAICQVLKNHTPQPSRTEIWKSATGATIINDTYCQDPQSIESALKLFALAPKGGKRIFLFNGLSLPEKRPKSDWNYIANAIAQADLDKLILTGNPTPLNQLLPSTHYSSTEKALVSLKKQLNSDDTVLIKGRKKESFDTLCETVDDSLYSNQCLINLAAIEENLNQLRYKLGNQTRLMVMVKALAYGTDHILMGKFLANCGIDILGVSYIDEAVALKRAGVTQSLFVLNAAPFEAKKAVKWRLEIGVSKKNLINALSEEAKRENCIIKLHLNIDTGMGRFGCQQKELLSLAKTITNDPYLKLEGIMTHFSCADNSKEDNFTKMQVKRFDDAIEQLLHEGIDPAYKHAANSSAALRFDFPQYNMARIGLSLYGLHSSPTTKSLLELKPALSLLSRIVGIKSCKCGDTISYGKSHTIAKENAKIAILPIGYFDALHRNYSNRAEVLIRGKRAPLVGNICMDFAMADITSIPEATVADPVLLFGTNAYGDYLPPEQLAEKGGTITHELLTSIGPRIPRIFIYEELPSNT